MSVTLEHYLKQADICAAEAERSALENVRERYLRSEATWRAMAARLHQAETMRDRREAEKALMVDAAD
jgi:hypothetical protein